MLSYPSDEVGNELVSLDKLDEAGVNPYSDVLSLEKGDKIVVTGGDITGKSGNTNLIKVEEINK